MINQIKNWIKKNGLLNSLIKALIIIFILVLILVLALNSVEVFIFSLLDLKEKHRVITFLSLGIGGLILILRTLAIEKQANNTSEQLKTQRFKDLIELLGHEKESVRLGACHSLHRIAKESDQEEEKKEVLNILCSHVRTITREKEYQNQNPDRPSAEIQTILDLIPKHSEQESSGVFEGGAIGLSRALLKGVQLTKQKGSRVFEGDTIDLSYAFLKEAQLTKQKDSRVFEGNTIDLSYAFLKGAQLFRTQFERAKLMNVQFQGADLGNAQFQGAKLMNVQFQGANLKGAQFQGAKPDQPDTMNLNGCIF